LAQVRVALDGITLQRLVEDLFNLFPSFHGRIPEADPPLGTIMAQCLRTGQ
jgi:hypothetical protein